MYQSDSTAARRTFVVELRDSNSNLLTGLVLAGASSEIQYSKNGGALTDAAGTWAELGGGAYSYVAPVGEIDTLGKVVWVFSKTGTTGFKWLEDILVDPTPEFSAITSKTNNLPSDPADASDLAASFATVNSTLATIATYVDTEVAAIKAKTDNLPSDPADASDVAASFATVNSMLSTIAGYIDTEVAAIKAKTDNIPASPATSTNVTDAVTSVNAHTDSALATTTSNVVTIKTNVDNIVTRVVALQASAATALTAIAAVQVDTDDIQTRLPASLDTGLMRAAIDQSSLTAVASTVWDEMTSDHLTADTFGELIQIMVGLMQGNAMIDKMIYDSSGVLVSSRLRIFASAAALTSATVDATDGADGEIWRFYTSATNRGAGVVGSFAKRRVL